MGSKPSGDRNGVYGARNRVLAIWGNNGVYGSMNGVQAIWG